MTCETDRFVLQANIERYKSLLGTDLAPVTRDTVQELLAQEEEALRAVERSGLHIRFDFSGSLTALAVMIPLLCQLT